MIYNRVFTVVLLFTLFFTSSVFAGKNKDKKLWWRDGQVVEELELTSEQVENIETIFQKYKGEIRYFHKELIENENKLKKLLENSNSTKEEVMKVTDELNILKAAGHKLKVNMFWEIREVLTPKQREQLQLIKEHYMKGTPKNTIYFLDKCLVNEHTFY